MSRNVAASIKARLLNKAKDLGEEFEPFLVRYVNERFLYRLGASALRDRCIVKGAALLSLWMKDPYRATRDVDLLGAGRSDEPTVLAGMETICRVPCPEDGLIFDLTTLSVSPIRDEQRYAGQRAVLQVRLGTAKVRLQVDFGFGDVVSPGPEKTEYPTLIDRVPAPFVRTYPRVAMIAEKFEAVVQLGRRNSRMKDFHDLWALSESFSFQGARLREAVEGCFARRGTAWTSEIPGVLSPAFYSDADAAFRWRAYLRKGHFRMPPREAFEQVGERVRLFLGPVRESIVAGLSFDMHWPAGGP